MQLSSARRRIGGALLALGAFSAACSTGAESGVNVKTVATDLTYGIPEEAASGAPANTSTEVADPIGTVQTGGGPSLEPIKIPVRKGTTTFCPELPPNVFPPAAPTTIEGIPKAGSYLWRVDGEQFIPEFNRTLVLPPILQREVSDVGKSGDGPKFTISERELVFGSQYTVRSTYEYLEGNVDETVEPGDPAPPSTNQNVDVTGLYLVRVERIHASNRDVNTVFNPSPPILVLPQPVTLGDSVNSTGVDPVSFEVLRQTGTVTKRVRVNACGKPMDVFYVEAVQEFAAADGRQQRRKFHYGIATAMGGLPIIEDVESPCVESASGCSQDAVTFRMKAHIARLEPLPAD